MVSLARLPSPVGKGWGWGRMIAFSIQKEPRQGKRFEISNAVGEMCDVQGDCVSASWEVFN
jgi:hypothetical protein